MKKELKELLKKTPFYKVLQYYRKLKLNQRVKYFHYEGEEMLQALSCSLHQANITFWLEFGTLLGNYREHDFIKHDLDIDIGAFLSDAPVVRKALTTSGFELVREYRCLNNSGREECYKYKHTTFDVFYFSETENERYCNSFSLREGISRRFNVYLPCVVKKIVVPKSEFEDVEYKGVMVKIPKQTDIYLQHHYGINYMTPNPDFDYTKEATNIFYYSYKDNPAEAFLKF